MGGHEKKPQKKEQGTFHPVQPTRIAFDAGANANLSSHGFSFPRFLFPWVFVRQTACAGFFSHKDPLEGRYV